ncbi:hypothetical protein [Nonomuraea typhae]|uniref:hypothetical protein n=1 Tax=Nonomuraea typhae TaxID=2603600 RepID=UPI0012F74965|nr:hypothetical protein [Nonomuraea typhae]
MSEQCPTCHGRGELPDEKTCALPSCGRQFRWQDDGRSRVHPRTDAAYCSKSCRDVAAQRARRSRVSASSLAMH